MTAAEGAHGVWRLGVEQPEEDEGLVLLFFFFLSKQ
jgi:hypothetical protein